MKLCSAPLLLLSNSNPLRWASSWLLVHDDRLHLFCQHKAEPNPRALTVLGFFHILLGEVSLIFSLVGFKRWKQPDRNPSAQRQGPESAFPCGRRWCASDCQRNTLQKFTAPRRQRLSAAFPAAGTWGQFAQNERQIARQRRTIGAQYGGGTLLKKRCGTFFNNQKRGLDSPRFFIPVPFSHRSSPLPEPRGPPAAAAGNP